MAGKFALTGKRLRDMRQDAGLTVPELETITGLDRMTIYRRETKRGEEAQDGPVVHQIVRAIRLFQKAGEGNDYPKPERVANATNAMQRELAV